MAEIALPSTSYEILELQRKSVAGGRASQPVAPPRNGALRREASGIGGLLGRAPAMEELFRRLEKASHGHSPVLIEGETGVGKRLTACTLHAMGPGAAGPFVAVDAASLEGRQGNVRELRNEIERAVLLTPDGAEVEPRALSPDLLPTGAASAGLAAASLKQRSRALEKKMLAETLGRNRWNVAATARELGISRVGLSKKLRSLDLKRPPRVPRG